jgi:O-antigen chain-terminating methyltransferase
MSDEALLNRLLAERRDAYRRYNEALTVVDRAIQAVPDFPKAPPTYDETLLPRINETWQILSGGDTPGADLQKLFERQMAFNAAVVEHLNRNVATHRETTAALERALPALRDAVDGLVRFESVLVQFLQTITPLADSRYREIDDAIAQLRTVTDVAQRTAMVAKREVERRTSAAGATGATGATQEFSPSDGSAYVGFEDKFRGSESAIRERQADYVQYFKGQSNVLDVGCGRGEFLDLLRENGVSATGLDLNSEMIEVCKSRGLDATTADARSFLRNVADESLGGLIAIQVVEHLQPQYLNEMLGLAFDKIRPGGHIVLETINPACWVAFFESFIRDLTHVKAIHPETLQYLLQASGFANVEIVYRAPIAPEGRLQRVTPRPQHYGETATDALTEIVTSFNQNVDRLNDRIFSFQDFAAIGRRP